MTVVARNDGYSAQQGDGTIREAIFVAAPNGLAIGGAAASGAANTGNPTKIGAVFNTTPPTVTNGQVVDAQADANGNIGIYPIVTNQTGSDAVANASMLSFWAGNSHAAAPLRVLPTANFFFNGTTWDRTKKPTSISRIVSAAGTTNATSAKASAGDVFKLIGYNAAAAIRFVKLYNKASAPTVGTDTPVMTIALPPSSAFDISFETPLYFATGIAYALTNLGADADTTALTAGDIVGLNLLYA